MTENIYGMLKRRFPITKFLHVNLNNAYKIIVACVMLHNMALGFNDEVPEYDHPDYVNRPELDNIVVVNDLPLGQMRGFGRLARDNWMATMWTRLTAREQMAVAIHRLEVEFKRRQR